MLENLITGGCRMLESVPYCWASASRPNTPPSVSKKKRENLPSQHLPQDRLQAPAPKSILFLVHDRPARNNEEAGYLLVQVQPVVSSEPKNIRLPLLVHLRLLYLSCLFCNLFFHHSIPTVIHQRFLLSLCYLD